MANPRLSLLCTNLPGAAPAGSTFATTTTACFNLAQLNNKRSVRVYDTARAAAAMAGQAEIFWDIEDMPGQGMPLAPGSGSRRHCRNNCKRTSTFLKTMTGLVPGCVQYVYRKFPASLPNAWGWTADQRAAVKAKAEFMRDNIGTASNVGPSTDLYLFSEMSTWNQAKMYASVDANLSLMREVYSAPGTRLVVFIAAENHPGSHANPWAYADNANFVDLNTRLQSNADVDVVLWGGVASTTPTFAPRDWPTDYSLSANYASFKAVWGVS